MLGAKRVVVTGASRGLGFDLCRLLMRAGGFEVVGTSRSWDAAKPALHELRELASSTQAGGGLRPSTFSALPLDVSDAESVLRFPAALARVLRNSKLNVLVNNAAHYPLPAAAWDEAALRAALEANAAGPLRLAGELLASGADDFHVVSVTSGLGRLAALREPYRALAAAVRGAEDAAALPFVAGYGGGAAAGSAPAYSISKAALNAGTVALAEAWRGSARLSAVDPGWCRTAMGGEGAPRSSRDGALSILAIVLGSAETIGTGGIFSSAGARVGQ